MKKKGVTAVLALLFGIFGVHRFYLGERLKGAIHLVIFFWEYALLREFCLDCTGVPRPGAEETGLFGR